MALFIATVFGTYAVAPAKAPANRVMGLDFLSFYTAGAAVREGRAGELYDLEATRRFQAALAEREGIAIGKQYAPWWNPPFYALAFAPLSALPFRAALGVWLAVNLLSIGAACWLMCRMLPAGTNWRSWALVPVLIALSTPFIATITHGQNTGTSLLILTLTVWFWREGRALAAGIACGLLFYKPQLGAVLALIMLLDLGWRAAAGVAITGCTLLFVTLIAMPGTLDRFLRQVPVNLAYVQEQSRYPWTRHATFKAFWRVLLEGTGVGPTETIVNVFAAGCMLAVAGMLVRAAISSHSRDRLIAATIVATPLVMPFYFDYDLLLLAVPVVLISVQFLNSMHSCPLSLRERGQYRVILCWVALYVWLMVNPDAAEATRVNLAVPLLAVLSFGMLLHVHRAESDASNWIDGKRAVGPING